jgi:hypothetical protein
MGALFYCWWTHFCVTLHCKWHIFFYFQWWHKISLEIDLSEF